MEFKSFIIVLSVTFVIISSYMLEAEAFDDEFESIFNDEDIILMKNIVDIETNIKRLSSDTQQYYNLVEGSISDNAYLQLLQKDFDKIILEDISVINKNFVDLKRHLSKIDVSEECRIAMNGTLNQLHKDIGLTKLHYKEVQSQSQPPKEKESKILSLIFPSKDEQVKVRITELPMKYQIFQRDITMLINDVNMLKRELSLDGYMQFEIEEFDYW